MWIRESVLHHLLLRLDEADKAISGKIAFDVLRRSQSTIFNQLGLKNKDLMGQGLDLYNSLVPKMKAELVDLYAKFQGGSIGYNEALESWKEVTGRYERRKSILPRYGEHEAG